MEKLTFTLNDSLRKVTPDYRQIIKNSHLLYMLKICQLDRYIARLLLVWETCLIFHKKKFIKSYCYSLNNCNPNVQEKKASINVIAIWLRVNHVVTKYHHHQICFLSLERNDSDYVLKTNHFFCKSIWGCKKKLHSKRPGFPHLNSQFSIQYAESPLELLTLSSSSSSMK